MTDARPWTGERGQVTQHCLALLVTTITRVQNAAKDAKKTVGVFVRLCELTHV